MIDLREARPEPRPARPRFGPKRSRQVIENRATTKFGIVEVPVSRQPGRGSKGLLCGRFSGVWHSHSRCKGRFCVTGSFKAGSPTGGEAFSVRGLPSGSTPPLG